MKDKFSKLGRTYQLSDLSQIKVLLCSIYQPIRMYETGGVSLGAPGLFSIELFVPWIYRIMLVYQEQKEQEKEIVIPKSIKFSKAYYMKKRELKESA